VTYISYETGVKGWRFRCDQVGAIFYWSYGLPFDETLFPYCPGAKTPARTDLGETPDPEGHIPHGIPDDGVIPPGPFFWRPRHKMTQMIITENEGPNYPGDLDDKSPESSHPSTRPPFSQRLHLLHDTRNRPGLPHPSEVRRDMDEWNRAATKIRPWKECHQMSQENMYGKTHPPSEIERDPRAVIQYWEKDSRTRKHWVDSHVRPLQSRNIPPLSTAPDSDTQEDDQQQGLHSLMTQRASWESQSKEAHERRENMLIAKLLALAVPTSDSQQNVPTHYKDIARFTSAGSSYSGGLHAEKSWKLFKKRPSVWACWSFPPNHTKAIGNRWGPKTRKIDGRKKGPELCGQRLFHKSKVLITQRYSLP